MSLIRPDSVTHDRNFSFLAHTVPTVLVAQVEQQVLVQYSTVLVLHWYKYSKISAMRRTGRWVPGTYCTLLVLPVVHHMRNKFWHPSPRFPVPSSGSQFPVPCSQLWCSTICNTTHYFSSHHVVLVEVCIQFELREKLYIKFVTPIDLYISF